MNQKKKLSLTILSFLVLLGAAPAAAQSPLRLRPGTMYLGGAVGLTHTESRVEEASGSVGVNRVEVNPSVGVFLGRRLALTASALWLNRDVEGNEDTTWGATLGLRTHLRSGSGHFYFGAELLYDHYQSETRFWQVGLRLGFGLLFPLHRRLALDAGVRMSLLRGKLDTNDLDSWYDTVVLQLGYLGVVGYFDL